MMSTNSPRRRSSLPHLLREIRGGRTGRAPAAAPPPPQAAPSESGLLVASYNVHKCVGTDRRFDPARVAEVIGELGADILALQEVDRRFGRRIGLLDMVQIERRTGLQLVPLAIEPEGHGWHGNALLVRAGRATRMSRMSLPGGEPRGAIMVELMMDKAGPLRVVAAHFGLLRRHRVRQVTAILDSLAAHAEMPTVLLGDLNEWRAGGRSSLRGLGHSFCEGEACPPTFPSRLPLLALDRIFCRPHGVILGVEAHESPLARLASDHLPLKARLDLARGLAGTARPADLATAA
jgi:endonuclease/exonuclease/phosphatase family metal-dependent hydrolase